VLTIGPEDRADHRRKGNVENLLFKENSYELEDYGHVTPLSKASLGLPEHSITA
jgi:hypothetical protein